VSAALLEVEDLCVDCGGVGPSRESRIALQRERPWPSWEKAGRQSTLARAVLRLIDPARGNVAGEGAHDSGARAALDPARDADRFQDPANSLDRA